jgi:hypothetical protein
MFYVIPGAVGELSEKKLAAASATMTIRILTTLIKEEVYALHGSFSAKGNLIEEEILTS